MERLGDAMPLRFWYYPHEINLSGGTSSGEGISGAVETNLSDTDERCFLRFTVQHFSLGDGCSQLAHHLRSEANSP